MVDNSQLTLTAITDGGYNILTVIIDGSCSILTTIIDGGIACKTNSRVALQNTRDTSSQNSLLAISDKERPQLQHLALIKSKAVHQKGERL
jgi:hypothetical protein